MKYRPAIHYSDVKHLRKSTLAYQTAINSDRKIADALLFGRAWEDYVIEGIEPTVKKKRDQYDKEAGAITESQYETLKGMKKTWDNYASKLSLSEKGATQYYLEATYPYWRPGNDVPVEVPFAGTLDYIQGKSIVDYKTIDSLSQIRSNIVNYGYYWQWFIYSHILTSGRSFYFIFQEKQPPYEIEIVQLDQSWFEVAEAEINTAIENWLWLANGREAQPKLTEGLTIIEPPQWKFKTSEIKI